MNNQSPDTLALASAHRCISELKGQIYTLEAEVEYKQKLLNDIEMSQQTLKEKVHHLKNQAKIAYAQGRIVARCHIKFMANEIFRPLVIKFGDMVRLKSDSILITIGNNTYDYGMRIVYADDDDKYCFIIPVFGKCYMPIDTVKYPLEGKAAADIEEVYIIINELIETIPVYLTDKNIQKLKENNWHLNMVRAMADICSIYGYQS